MMVNFGTYMPVHGSYGYMNEQTKYIRNLTSTLAKFCQQAKVSTNCCRDQCAIAEDKTEFCGTNWTILNPRHPAIFSDDDWDVQLPPQHSI